MVIERARFSDWDEIYSLTNELEGQILPLEAFRAAFQELVDRKSVV